MLISIKHTGSREHTRIIRIELRSVFLVNENKLQLGTIKKHMSQAHVGNMLFQ